MDGDKEVRLMNTESSLHAPIDDYKNSELSHWMRHSTFTPRIYLLGLKQTRDVLRVRVVSRGRNKQGNKIFFDKKCPLCMSDSLAIVGGRTSTLSSVAVSQIMSSDFDAADGSKRKMLTFSNSVQDAAHLAGFYEVRTFRFLFRQSIQYYLKQIG
jgi:DEAD/DEAH box helicase domain-containing protein